MQAGSGIARGSWSTSHVQKAAGPKPERGRLRSGENPVQRPCFWSLQVASMMHWE